MATAHPIAEVEQAAERARDAVDRYVILSAVAIAAQIEGVAIEAILAAKENSAGALGAARDLAYYLAATTFSLSAYRIAMLTSRGSSRLGYSRRGVQHAIDRVVDRREKDEQFDRRLDRLDQIIRGA